MKWTEALLRPLAGGGCGGRLQPTSVCHQLQLVDKGTLDTILSFAFSRLKPDLRLDSQVIRMPQVFPQLDRWHDARAAGAHNLAPSRDFASRS